MTIWWRPLPRRLPLALGDQWTKARPWPLVSAAHHATVSGLVARGRAAGARVVAGGRRAGGLLFKPRSLRCHARDGDLPAGDLRPRVGITAPTATTTRGRWAKATQYGLAANSTPATSPRPPPSLRAAPARRNGRRECLSRARSPFGGSRPRALAGRDKGIHGTNNTPNSRPSGSTLCLSLDPRPASCASTPPRGAGAAGA